MKGKVKQRVSAAAADDESVIFGARAHRLVTHSCLCMNTLLSCTSFAAVALRFLLLACSHFLTSFYLSSCLGSSPLCASLKGAAASSCHAVCLTAGCGLQVEITFVCLTQTKFVPF